MHPPISEFMNGNTNPNAATIGCTIGTGLKSTVDADVESGQLRSLHSVFFAECLSALPDHTNFLATETCILYRHAEECVFVFLVVGGKGVLMEQNQFCVIRAGFREFRKCFSDHCDQARLSLHAFVIGNHAKRIADSESERVLHAPNANERSSGSEEGVVSNHDSYSDRRPPISFRVADYSGHNCEMPT